MENIESQIAAFSPISLDEMSAVKLMNRTDTKFVTTMPRLLSLLTMLRNDYFAQEIDGRRNMSYSTLYLDSEDFSLYNDHQHGRANRQKIRLRTYTESDLRFLEIKTKNNHGRTKKKRIAVDGLMLGEDSQRLFVARHLRCPAERLLPHVSTSFRRITLVNRAKTERLTIDSDLCFENVQTGRKRSMGQLVIIELKRDGLQQSPSLNFLKLLRIHTHGFSKYCIGAALTNDSLPLNRFKPKLHFIERLQL